MRLQRVALSPAEAAMMQMLQKIQKDLAALRKVVDYMIQEPDDTKSDDSDDA